MQGAWRFLVMAMAVLLMNGCIVIAPGGLLGGGSDYQEVQVMKGGGIYGKKILILDVDGTISSGPQSTPGLFGGGDSTVNEVAEKLAKARRDKSIKAVILRVDSPGGGVTASDVVYRLISEYKKETGVPVYSSMLDMATSGGYYISMAADEVYAHPTTVTGSVGVIAIFPQFQDMGRKIGLYAEIIKSGDNKDIAGGFVNMTPEQRVILQTMINEMYERFLQVVTEGRPKLDPIRIRELADGRVYTAQQAVDNGMIDGILYTDQVVQKAREAIRSPRAQVVIYRKTSRDTVDSIYASTPSSVRPQADAAGDTNLLKVDADLFSSDHRPVFQYMWVP